MADCVYDKRTLFESTIGGLTIIELMKRMKTFEGRKGLTTQQQRIAEAIRRDEFLFEMIKDELNRNESENEKEK